jgi:hypothetical protein
MLELILDFLPWPGRSRDQGDSRDHGDSVLRKVMPGAIRVLLGEPGAIKRALNDNGWLAAEVIAAGELRQGKEPSPVAMATGMALIELLRPRRARSLPRRFVLAVTTDRVVAFKAVGVSEDDGPHELWIRPGERSSWPRESLRLVDLSEGAASTAGTLVLGTERVPVFRPNPDPDPSTDELLELLGG